MECEYKLDTTTQVPGDTIEWFHRVFLAQLATSRAHGGMPGYHPVLVKQHMDVLMTEVGVTAATEGTLTTKEELLAHAEKMAIMRAKAVETSCKEYLACKFLLLSNGEQVTPLRIHLKNGQAKGKKPYPTTVKGMKTLMVDYNAPGVAAPRPGRKDDNDQEFAFAETQEWDDMKKALMCFGCGKKGHLLEEYSSTSRKERQKIWHTKHKGFKKDDASSAAPRRRRPRRQQV